MSPLTKSLFKSAGIIVSNFFSMLPFTLKYLCSVEPVRMHFPAKMHSDRFNRTEILQGRWQHGEKVGYCYPSGLEKTFCKWDIYMSCWSLKG